VVGEKKKNEIGQNPSSGREKERKKDNCRRKLVQSRRGCRGSQEMVIARTRSEKQMKKICGKEKSVTRNTFFKQQHRLSIVDTQI